MFHQEVQSPPSTYILHTDDILFCKGLSQQG